MLFGGSPDQLDKVIWVYLGDHREVILKRQSEFA